MEVPDSVYDATVQAIEAAKHLTALDLGAVSAILQQAKLVDDAVARGNVLVSGSVDSVTIPVYLKYCESLGLTPVSRAAMDAKRSVRSSNGKLPASLGLTALQGGLGA